METVPGKTAEETRRRAISSTRKEKVKTGTCGTTLKKSSSCKFVKSRFSIAEELDNCETSAGLSCLSYLFTSSWLQFIAKRFAFLFTRAILHKKQTRTTGSRHDILSWQPISETRNENKPRPCWTRTIYTSSSRLMQASLVSMGQFVSYVIRVLFFSYKWMFRLSFKCLLFGKQTFNLCI